MSTTSETTHSPSNKKITIRISARDFLTSVMCFVFSKATLLSYMNPFGMAIYAANFTPTGWYWALVSSVMGIIITKGDMTAARYIFALGLATPIVGIFDKGGVVFRSVVMSLSYFAVSMALSFADGFLMYDVIFVAFESFICFVSTVMLCNVTQTIMEYKNSSAINTGQAVAIVAAVCIFILSCAGVPPVFGLNVCSLICIFLLLCIGLAKGPVAAAAAGIIGGTVVSFAYLESVSVIGAFALCAFVAGLFRRYSRLGVLLGFTLANGVITAFLNDTVSVLVNPIEVIDAGIVFVTLPHKTLSLFCSFPDKLSQKQYDRQISTPAEHINNMSECLGELSVIYKQSCNPRRLGKKYTNNLFNACVERACTNCNLKYNCWQSATYRNYEYMSQMLQYANSKGYLDNDGLPKEFAKQCAKSDEFVRVFNFLYDVYKTDKMWLEKMYRIRLVMARQLECISRAMTKQYQLGKVMYSVQSYCIQNSKAGETVCGDSVCELELFCGDYAVILSDGMGSGENASRESSDTVNMLKLMIMSGFDISDAIEIINSSLIIRSDKESFSTIDLMYVNCHSGKVTLVKVGCAPTYALIDKNLTKYECNNLPVGILKDIQLQTYSFDVDKEGFVIMVSDGISNTILKNDDTDYIYECIKNIDTNSPKEISQRVMEEAIALGGGTISDDMTVQTVVISSKTM